MEDVSTHPLTRAKSASYAEVGVPSYAVQPFRRDGDWTVCLVVTERLPRKWTAYDLRTLEDVVARVPGTQLDVGYFATVEEAGRWLTRPATSPPNGRKPRAALAPQSDTWFVG